MSHPSHNPALTADKYTAALLRDLAALENKRLAVKLAEDKALPAPALIMAYNARKQA